MTTIKLSPYQQGMVDWVRTGTGSAFGEAVAGSGKTTTALYCAYEMKGFVAVMAYNKSASKEFMNKAVELKLNFDNRVKFGTVHSFGFQGWRRVYPNVKVDEKEKRLRSIAHLRAIHQPEEYDNFVLKLVSLAKNNAVGLSGDIEDLSKWYEIVTHHDMAYDLDIKSGVSIDGGIKLAVEMLKLHQKMASELIDFDDMIYMPIVSGVKLFENDWVVGDEWQDANKARRALARKLLKPRGRALFIGDRRQAIYGFTGADSSSIDNTIKEFDCTELPLTVSYRCPKAVIEEARTIVDHIEAYEGAPEGYVNRDLDYKDFLERYVNPKAPNKTPDELLLPSDAIVCRMTKPIVSLAYVLIRNGIGCHVEGREIGQGLLKLIGRWKRIRTIEELRAKLEEWLPEEMQKLIAKGAESQAGALNDRVETIFTIMDAAPPATTLAELERRISAMFVDGDFERKPTLTLSTIHKAKGREWRRVFIYGRADYMPSKWARQAWEKEQEENLIYVAITRAQDQLYYINCVESRKES